MSKVFPFLWFNDQAEQAAAFYVSLLPNSRIVSVSREAGEGSKAFMVTFELDGVSYMALNGGPHFTFNEAVSLHVHCDDQAEIDRLWERLTADGGAPSQCGWLKDRYGLSWQIVPRQMKELVHSGDPERTGRVMSALRGMVKLDLAELQRAAAGG